MAGVILAITIIMLASIAVPAFADSTDGEQANGVPSLAVRYAVVESKIDLTIGTIEAITDLIPEASDLNEYAVKLNNDLNTLQTYVTANDTTGFNAYIRSTIQPDMQAANKAIITDKQQFKAWGVTKEKLKLLKEASKKLKTEYNVGKHVSEVAKGKKNKELQDYLTRAGIQVQDDQNPTAVPSVEPTTTPTPTSEPTAVPSPTTEPTPTPAPTETITPVPSATP
jgi:hypothetical protein